MSRLKEAFSRTQNKTKRNTFSDAVLTYLIKMPESEFEACKKCEIKTTTVVFF